MTEPTRRSELIQIAAHLFRQQGYERTTVRDIAHRAGMKSGSIFYHFRSKEEILHAVMALGITDTTEKLRQALAHATTPQAKIATLFHVHLRSLLADNRDALAVMLYEWRSVSEASRPELIALRDEYEALWQPVLTEAAAAGVIAAKQDIALLRRMLLGALHWSAQWFDDAGQYDVETLAEQMLACFFQQNNQTP